MGFADTETMIEFEIVEPIKELSASRQAQMARFIVK